MGILIEIITFDKKKTYHWKNSDGKGLETDVQPRLSLVRFAYDWDCSDADAAAFR